MIHSLADYSNEKQNENKNSKGGINLTHKIYPKHKSLGKYPIPKNNNNINSSDKPKNSQRIHRKANQEIRGGSRKRNE